jgi:hypothetical protein
MLLLCNRGTHVAFARSLYVYHRVDGFNTGAWVRLVEVSD